MQSQTEKTVYSLQYLRGLAAVIVLFQHVAIKGTQYSGDPLPWFHLGEAGVELFFVISGFIMCHTTQHSLGRPTEVGRFLVNRFTRILPLYWLLTAVALVVFWIAPDKVNSSGGVTKVWESFVLIPVDGKFLIMNGWTLSYEFFFYFIFSIGLFWRGSGRWVTAGLLLGLVALGWATEPASVLGRFATSTLLLNFLLGIVLFEVYRRQGKAPLAVSGLIFAAGVGFLILWNQELWRPFGPLGLGFPCFLLSLGLVLIEDRLRKRPSWVLKLAGDSSYSMYLLHPFTLAGGALVLQKVGLTSGPWAWPFLVTLFLGSLVAGALLFWFVEKPLTQAVRGIKVFTRRVT